MKTILFLGDTHVGSKYALWPRDRMPAKHTTAALKRVEYLNECFTNMVKALPRLDLLILTGDLIEGKQRRSDATGLFTADIGEQVEAAMEVLHPVCKKATRIMRVYGTPYHEEYFNALRALDEKMGVQRLDVVLDLDLDGQILNVAHHPSGGSALYTGTAVDKESIWSAVASADGKVVAPRWIVRAHKHTYIKQDTENRTVVLCPCFQLPTPYAIKQQYWRFQPTFGCVLMQQDKLERGGYRFLPRLFPVPKREVINV